MIVLKIIYHIRAFVQYLFFKLLYRGSLHIGNNVTWRNDFTIMIGKEGKIEIGKNCFFNNGCSLNANKHIKIGEGTLFGESVKVYDHNHRFSDINRPIKEQGFSNGEVIIGNHCWIGSNVVILKGSIIEDHCVISAGCVVNGYIKRNTLLKMNISYKSINYM